MQPVRRVLVATDLSPGSEAAVDRAVLLARAHGACVDLVHAFDAGAWHALQRVFDVQRLGGDAPPDVVLRERLSARAEALAAATGLDVEAHFGAGEPAGLIEGRVKATRAALVVIARRADPATPGVGSTLLRLLHTASCPVLVVRGNAHLAYERVLTAVDLREVSRRAAEVAVGLFPAAVHRLLCVVDPAWERERWRRNGALEQDPAQPPASMEPQSLQALAQHQLNQLAQALSVRPDTRVVAEVAEAVPVRAIVGHAAAWPADCVVVGRHGHGLLADRLLGSTALDVLHHTARDVLVVS